MKTLSQRLKQVKLVKQLTNWSNKRKFDGALKTIFNIKN